MATNPLVGQRPRKDVPSCPVCFLHLSLRTLRSSSKDLGPFPVISLVSTLSMWVICPSGDRLSSGRRAWQGTWLWGSCGKRPSSLASPTAFRLWRQSHLLSPALLLSLVYTSAFSPAPLAPEGADVLGALLLGSRPHVASDPPPWMEQVLFCPRSETSLQ